MLNKLIHLYVQNRKKNINYFSILIKKNQFHKLLFSKRNYVPLPGNNCLYFIKSGDIKESITEESGNIKTLRILTQGDFIYYPNSKDIIPLWSLQVLKNGTELYKISIDDFSDTFLSAHELIYHNYNLGLQMYYFKWLYMSSPGETRVLLAILDLLISTSINDSRPQQKEYILPKYVTHELISEFSALSRSYVTRIINKCIQKNLLLYKNNKLTIKDIDTFVHYLNIKNLN